MAERLFEPARQADQELVAGLMALAVVDDLEPIDVEEEHGEARRVGTGTPAEQPLDAIHEHGAVGQAGQRVGPPRRDLRADPGQGDGEVVRLGHVVVGAELERFDDVFGPVLGGDHDHRQVRDRS